MHLLSMLLLHECAGGLSYYNFIRKPASDFGWDWGPAFAPAGIYGMVEIQAYSYAIMTGAFAALSLPLCLHLTAVSMSRAKLRSPCCDLPFEYTTVSPGCFTRATSDIMVRSMPFVVFCLAASQAMSPDSACCQVISCSESLPHMDELGLRMRVDDHVQALWRARTTTRMAACCSALTCT